MHRQLVGNSAVRGGGLYTSSLESTTGAGRRRLLEHYAGYHCATYVSYYEEGEYESVYGYPYWYVDADHDCFGGGGEDEEAEPTGSTYPVTTDVWGGVEVILRYVSRWCGPWQVDVKTRYGWIPLPPIVSTFVG